MGHGGSSGGGITCVTIAEADGYKTPSLSFPSESKSERELDILNWAYQLRELQPGPAFVFSYQDRTMRHELIQVQLVFLH